MGTWALIFWAAATSAASLASADSRVTLSISRSALSRFACHAESTRVRREIERERDTRSPSAVSRATCTDRIVHTLHRTPYPFTTTIHPTLYTLHPSPYTLLPTPYTLNHTPYTLNPEPYTLNAARYTRLFQHILRSETASALRDEVPSP